MIKTSAFSTTPLRCCVRLSGEQRAETGARRGDTAQLQSVPKGRLVAGNHRTTRLALQCLDDVYRTGRCAGHEDCVRVSEVQLQGELAQLLFGDAPDLIVQ